MADQDHTLRRAVEALKEPVQIDPALNLRVMDAIEQMPRPLAQTSGMRSVIAWLRQRRTFQLSPLTGLLATAGMVAILFIGSRLNGRSEPPTLPAAVVVQPSGQVMQFVLVAPEAASVTLVGDFNDWSLSATPLVRQDGDGVWWVTLPLAPGRYRYAFVVDGSRWRNDPSAPSAEDEFGRPNSVVTIGGA